MNTWTRQICWLAPGHKQLSEIHLWWTVREQLLCSSLKHLNKESLLPLHCTQQEEQEGFRREVPISATLQHFPALANSSTWLQLLPPTSRWQQSSWGRQLLLQILSCKPWGSNPESEPLRHGPNRQSVTAELLKMTLCDQHGPARPGTACSAGISGVPLSSEAAKGDSHFTWNKGNQNPSYTPPRGRNAAGDNWLFLFGFCFFCFVLQPFTTEIPFPPMCCPMRYLEQPPFGGLMVDRRNSNDFTTSAPSPETRSQAEKNGCQSLSCQQ